MISTATVVIGAAAEWIVGNQSGIDLGTGCTGYQAKKHQHPEHQSIPSSFS
jgi:hypothetical protein